MYLEKTHKLTHAAVMAMLQAAVNKAEEIGQPQCIVIVDASGVMLGQIRMDGAKFLSMKSATAKAQTAASIGAESDVIPADFGLNIALATQGNVTRLGGGMPIKTEGMVIGGIGVGSGSAEQDKAVAQAALDAIGL